MTNQIILLYAKNLLILLWVATNYLYIAEDTQFRPTFLFEF